MGAQTMLFLFAVGGLTIFNIMPGIISGLGEEYGWRGLMFPALQSRKPWVGYGLGGTVWYVWHLPLMLLFPMPKLSWTFLAASSASLVGTIAMHVFLCRAYTQSGSIFVPSLTHATFNNAARSFAYYAILTNQLVGNVVVALSMVAVVVVQSRILTNRRLPPSATTS
jgi:membrane protease YdiL (CAAX protease family)